MHSSSEATRRACEAWRKQRFAGYIDVSTPALLQCWLTFLVAAGVSACRLVIRMVDPSEAEVQRMVDHFSATMGSVPAIDASEAGYMRPSAYLQISSKDIPYGATAAPAAVNMAGFCALMLTACVRSALIQKNAEVEVTV